MCGFVGFLQERGLSAEAKEIAGKMALQIQHRGPDDAGVWVDESSKIVLAHRRSSIIDLSQAAHQPMVSPCCNYVLVYNGEIYNNEELRAGLAAENGHFDWRGHSDTETLLAALRHWGIEGALSRLNGMFAFALWDVRSRALFLARDRMGEKPLYYGRSGNTFLFGSELKAFTKHPEWQGKVNRDALALYLRHNYVPEPWSIYQGIYKLPPANYIVIRDCGKEISKPLCYWNLRDFKVDNTEEKSIGAEKMTDALDGLLLDAVGRRMVSDVPLGAFLSGGFDSTLVVAMMQAQSNVPVKTFTVGFQEKAYNEAEQAKKIANYLGTNHTELHVTPAQSIDVIPDLPLIYDEPFSDSSQIPTFLISQLARKSVTVSLSGDGGDELFYGYDRYIRCEKLLKLRSRVPYSVLYLANHVIGFLPSRVLDGGMVILPPHMRIDHFADRLPKLLELLMQQDSGLFYRDFVSHWKAPDKVVIGSREPETLLNSSKTTGADIDQRELMMFFDLMTYLPGDILTKVDRATMAVSLEARVPMLDHRVVEFASKVPVSLKYRDGYGKWLLRQVLYKYVPRELMEMKKKGFTVPIEHWLCGPLRDWAEDLLDEKQIREAGYFDPKPIRKMWQEHLSQKRRWHHCLWDILMFNAWLRTK